MPAIKASSEDDNLTLIADHVEKIAAEKVQQVKKALLVEQAMALADRTGVKRAAEEHFSPDMKRARNVAHYPSDPQWRHPSMSVHR